MFKSTSNFYHIHMGVQNREFSSEGPANTPHRKNLETPGIHEKLTWAQSGIASTSLQLLRDLHFPTVLVQ